jgi:hypothetical protein
MTWVEGVKYRCVPGPTGGGGTGDAENRIRRLKREDINTKTQADFDVQVLTTPKALPLQCKAEYQRVYSAPRPLH